MFLRSFLLGSYEVDEFLLRMNLQFLVHMTNVHLRGVSRYAQVVFYSCDISAERQESKHFDFARGKLACVRDSFKCALRAVVAYGIEFHMRRCTRLCFDGRKRLLVEFCMRMVQVFLIGFVFVAAACIVFHANKRCSFFERGNPTVGFACD